MAVNELLSTIDIVIIAIYFVFVILLGVYFKKSQSSEESYFLAGRSLLWPIIGLSLFASNMSSISLVGLAESGFSDGFAVFSYEWMAGVVLVIFAVFFLPFYLKSRIYTIPEFLEKRYNHVSRYYFSAVTIILVIFIDLASSLYAGSVVVQMVFPDMTITQIIWMISIFAALYTLLGGLSSVVYSDAVQAVLLVGGSIVISVLAYQKVGGWEGITAHVAPENLTIIRSADSEVLPWPALFSGVFLLGFYFWITNQFITQRALASKNVAEGQKGAIFAGFLKLITLFIMILPGVIAFILYPDLESAKLAYPTLVFDLLPTGLLGLVIAGFIAALMSSVDSGLNAASTLVTFDFYKKINKNASYGSTIRVSQIATGVFMVLAALWSPHIESFPSLWDYLQTVLSFVCPPIVALFIFGIFTSKVNKNGANAAVITGVVLGLFGLLVKSGAVFESLDAVMPHYLYLAGIIFILCSVILLVVSLMYPVAPSDEVKGLIWTVDYYKAETKSLQGVSWFGNYRVLAVILLVSITALLIIF